MNQQTIDEEIEDDFQRIMGRGLDAMNAVGQAYQDRTIKHAEYDRRIRVLFKQYGRECEEMIRDALLRRGSPELRIIPGGKR